MTKAPSKGGGGELVSVPLKFSAILKNQKNRELLRGALTHGLDMSRFVKCAWIQVSSNEDIRGLAQTNPTSVFRAMLQCAQMGLYCDGISGDAYLVKFGNQCVAIRGYRGLMRLFGENNPDAAPMPVVFDTICENDEWEYERGATPSLMHKPAKKDRGAITHYYAAARFKDGSVWPKVMSAAEVEEFKKYAKTDKFWGSPHPNTRKWQRIKTVIRQLFKEVPIPSSVSRERIYQEETFESGDITVDNYLELVSGEDEQPQVHGADVRKTEAVPQKQKAKSTARPAKQSKPAEPDTPYSEAKSEPEPWFQPETKREEPEVAERAEAAQYPLHDDEPAEDDDKLFE